MVYDRYGPPDVLRIAEVERPVPKDDEVLVRIHAATVNRSDAHTREANRSNGPAVMFISRLVSGWGGPRQRILGTELAGDVVAVGTVVRKFVVGDEVFANTGFRFGANAEYATVPENGRIALKPSNMSFEEAAAVTDGALNCIWCFRSANLRKDESVLVYGASGSVGTAGVQLAKSFGANVTAVCNAKNIELVRSLGADEVIDYMKEDFTKNGRTYDVIFDAVGKHSFGRSKGSLKPGGRYIATDQLGNLFLAAWTGRFGGKKVIFPIPPRYTQEDMLFLKQLIEAGKYRAVIDRRYPLEDVVEATRYVETQQKVGNVVLTITN
ncbi:MAG TPA: NAD(P)-dependent alcohol dehydrogenase [Candidatus Dormibacteraeota bacterium]|nr:NAD(P)-dependent alcohol dehydrogenase [Candidatus Dormibacteraeota bacterium]